MTTRQLSLGAFDPPREELGPGAVLLRRFAFSYDEERTLVAAIDTIVEAAPFRHMITPGGFRMSVAMTNAGALGWVTDLSGYRYTPRDPESDRPWPAIPSCLLRLASRAAKSGGFDGFVPDACLVNRYEPEARMTLHQDKNERDFAAPIVSVSLGIPAVFLWGGEKRNDTAKRVPLAHGDVVVWGGPSRLRFHGVLPLKDDEHPLLGRQRLNLTFRKAG
ncbi:Alkylated DNA repair protein AlkB [Labilithrix luteola]|uniref:Alkylated DNA repair protein AlkB n=1 Tax=Labilithrix luteola TaxID=1391654 RepID=A0A0K1PST9_9BACT|nr:DNA oxidative demethylase AlkB [Labilithrix luteola]AKU96582.1 Alkylated DNA repair protein AlkB [Labilithrix luteola]